MYKQYNLTEHIVDVFKKEYRLTRSKKEVIEKKLFSYFDMIDKTYFTPKYAETFNNVPGVYIYAWKNKCLYVGATKNLKIRGFRILRNPLDRNSLMSCIIKEVSINNISVYTIRCKESRLGYLEKRYSRELKPFCSTHFQEY